MRLLRSLKTGFNISGKVILLALLTYSAFAVEPSEKAKQAFKYIQSKDYDQARPLLTEASKDGDTVAQFALSNAYENGLIGFKSDIKQRNYWLKLSRRAIQMGNTKPQPKTPGRGTGYAMGRRQPGTLPLSALLNKGRNS
jgi:hypothetical protein